MKVERYFLISYYYIIFHFQLVLITQEISAIKSSNRIIHFRSVYWYYNHFFALRKCQRRFKKLLTNLKLMKIMENEKYYLLYLLTVKIQRTASKTLTPALTRQNVEWFGFFHISKSNYRFQLLSGSGRPPAKWWSHDIDNIFADLHKLLFYSIHLKLPGSAPKLFYPFVQYQVAKNSQTTQTYGSQMFLPWLLRWRGVCRFWKIILQHLKQGKRFMLDKLYIFFHVLRAPIFALHMSSRNSFVPEQ